jgi:hypothetical protein
VNTTDLPSADVFAVQLNSDGPPQCVGKVTVRCPYCTQLHAHRVFDNDTIVFTRVAPCSSDAKGHRYRVDLNLTVPKRTVSHPHPVYVAGDDLDDNAFDVPEPNWIE